MSCKVEYKDWQKKGNARHLKFPYKRLYNKLLRSAERKNIPIDLTYEEFLDYTNYTECHYCDSKVTWIKHGKTATAYNLDRIDNSLGYTKDNCVIACWRCNNSRGNRYTYQEWFDMNRVFRK